jgi:hypothetical protein
MKLTTLKESRETKAGTCGGTARHCADPTDVRHIAAQAAAGAPTPRVVLAVVAKNRLMKKKRKKTGAERLYANE